MDGTSELSISICVPQTQSRNGAGWELISHNGTRIKYLFPCRAVCFHSIAMSRTCQVLSKALQINKGISHIDLRRNNIGDAGAQAMDPFLIRL